MTELAPHRATPEQWERVQVCEQHNHMIPWSTASCLLELRDRLATAEQRIRELEATQHTHPESVDIEPNAAPVTPAGPLVEAVARIIHDTPCGYGYENEARAAILAVAEWLDLKHGAVSVGSIWLREEVERHG